MREGGREGRGGEGEGRGGEGREGERREGERREGERREGREGRDDCYTYYSEAPYIQTNNEELYLYNNDVTYYVIT